MTIDERELEWEKERRIREREYKLRKDRRDLRSSYSIKPSTSKLLILFLFINCTIIEIFTGWVTIKSISLASITGFSPDFTPLTTLIGAVVSEVIGFAVYAIKSAKENTKGGIVYERAMSETKNPTLKEEPASENSEAVG